ncbi:LysE family translocator, partial [Rhizobiaceae bacterium]|nr:LysE family translocator [Rhizobiaceae bacterium]
YGTGLFVGSNLVMLAAAAGFAALLASMPTLRLILVALSTAYLLWLAFRIAFAGSRIAFIEAAKAPGLAGGVALQIFNPKAYAVGAFVFSNFPILPNAPIGEIAVKLAVLNAIWIPVHVGWLMAGVKLGQLDLAPESQRLVNYTMALAMLLVVGLALASSFRG